MRKRLFELDPSRFNFLDRLEGVFSQSCCSVERAALVSEDRPTMAHAPAPQPRGSQRKRWSDRGGYSCLSQADVPAVVSDKLHSDKGLQRQRTSVGLQRQRTSVVLQRQRTSVVGFVGPQHKRVDLGRPHKLKKLKKVIQGTGLWEDLLTNLPLSYEFDIPEDSYGAATLAIIMSVQRLSLGASTHAATFLRDGFSLVILMVNLMLQVGILMFIDYRVVEPGVHMVQTVYADYRAKVFDVDGTFQPALWDTYEDKQTLCQLGLTSNFFYMLILFIWVTAMLCEFRASYALIREVNRMPVCSSSDLMLLETPDKVSVVALTPVTRWLLYSLVCTPKLLISIFLLFLGCQWLTASTTFEALVMNSVAMEFVLHIDELLYRAFVPADYRKQVAGVNFLVQLPERTEEQARRKAWNSYVWSLAFMIGGIVFTLVYVTFLQNVLPHDLSDVRTHCGRYISETGSVLCSGWDASATHCYPFGNQSGWVEVRGPDH